MEYDNWVILDTETKNYKVKVYSLEGRVFYKDFFIMHIIFKNRPYFNLRQVNFSCIDRESAKIISLGLAEDIFQQNVKKFNKIFAKKLKLKRKLLRK